jgi:multidrug efflux pump subunit AcrA (membrane-fusion protein)
MVELEVDNSDGTLLAGGYTDVHIKLPTATNTIILPVNTLLFRDGLRVGVVKNGHIALTPITIGRDYGKTVEVVSGLAVGDEVVLNPPDSLQDGAEVHVTKPDDKKTDDKESKDKK